VYTGSQKEKGFGFGFKDSRKSRSNQAIY